jgi:hypothetical protein
MDVTFNLSGDNSSGSLVTKTFYYVGNYNNLPLYSTKDETDTVTVNNWIIYNGGSGGSFGAEWIIARGSPNTRSYTNPSETTISSISSPDLGDYLYRTNNLGSLKLGAATTIKNYKPYPHVSEDWLDSFNLDATNLAFSTRNLFVPFNEVSPYSSVQKNIIGDFVRIHRDEALVKKSSVEYDFYVDGDGSHPKNLADSEPKSVYVTYKKEFTPFSVEPTDAPTSTAVVPQEFFQYITGNLDNYELICSQPISSTYTRCNLTTITAYYCCRSYFRSITRQNKSSFFRCTGSRCVYDNR